MTDGGAFGPFKPGFGGMPPHLAGREEEQNLFRGLLTDMENGESLARRTSSSTAHAETARRSSCGGLRMRQELETGSKRWC